MDALLAAPGASPKAFGEKLRVLEAEYGRDWQPRHVAALIADPRDPRRRVKGRKSRRSA